MKKIIAGMLLTIIGMIVGLTYDSDAFRSFADKVKMQRKTITVPKVNDTFRLGSASVRILGPYSTTMGDNNSSIILRITYGKTSFLHMGMQSLRRRARC